MTTGAHFRYQTEDASYHYNLKTTGLTTGTWQLNFATSAAGATHSGHFDVR